MLLTEQEIDALRKSLPAVCRHQDAFRAAESAVLAKLKAQEPVVFWLCDGCGHYYQECEDGQRPVSSCDCMTDATMFRKEFYTNPDPRVAELEAVLRECREVLMHYQYGGSNYKKPADKAIAKIDEVLK